MQSRNVENTEGANKLQMIPGLVWNNLQREKDGKPVCKFDCNAFIVYRQTVWYAIENKSESNLYLLTKT